MVASHDRRLCEPCQRGGLVTGALRADRVTVRFGRRGTAVLSGTSLEVPAGDVTGLCGPSGSGKSTLVRVLAGLLTPNNGSVTIDGAPQQGTRGRGWGHGDVAVLFQSPRRSASPRFTLHELVTEAAQLRGLPTPPAVIDHVLDRVGLTSDLLGRGTGQVSDGQLQRACLARALLARPRYLLCDEPTAMLDPITTAGVAAAIGSAAHDDGLGVLVVSHDLELLSVWADQVRDFAAA